MKKGLGTRLAARLTRTRDSQELLMDLFWIIGMLSLCLILELLVLQSPTMDS